jgi:glycerol-3-phosphate acyltransferase PlsY
VNWQIVLLAGVVGYLCGSVSFARIVSGLANPDVEIDGIELEGMHVDAISGTAVSMKLGPRLGGLTAILDITKVAVPTLVFRLLYPSEPYYLVAAAMGLVGHNWPVYYRFKGGRGMSAIYGGFLVVDWLGALVTSVLGMTLGLFVLRDVLISYLGGLWLMIPWVWLRTRDVAHLAYAVFVNVIFVVAMIPEIRQVMKLRREGAPSDLSTQMEATPMGKMMKKMVSRFGLFDDEG